MKKDKKIPYFPKKDELCDHWVKQIEDADSQRETWNGNRNKWHKMRMRIRKVKTFPFAGCANVKMPTAENQIRKLKAPLVNTVFGIRPVVQAITPPGVDPSKGVKVEKFIDHLIMDIDRAKLRSIRGVDQELEQGFVVLKPYWKYEDTNRVEEVKAADLPQELNNMIFSVDIPDNILIQRLAPYFEIDMSDDVVDDNIEAIKMIIASLREGKDTVNVVFKDVLANHPSFDVYDANKVYVPSDSLADPQNARWIAFEDEVPYETLVRNAKKEKWDIAAIKDIDWLRTADTPERKNYLANSIKKVKDIDIKDLSEGIDTLNNPSHLVKIIYLFGWHDVNGDGEEEKALITFAPDFKKILKKQSLPYDNGKFPAIKLAYEQREDRWYAHRGIPELIEDIIKEIDTQHNMKLDAMTIRNAPMFTFRSGAVNPRLIKFIPGQAIPRQEKDDIAPLNNANPQADFSWDREQQLLESKVSELVGQVDYSLQSMINRRQPRTAEEVAGQKNASQMVFSLDADLTIEAFSELFQWYLDLWSQYGDETKEIAYFGSDGYETIKMNREEVQGMRLVVRGNDKNTNPQTRMQTAQLILQDVYQALATGTATPMEVFNARKRFYQALGETNPEQFVKPPQPPRPQPSPEVIKTIFDKLTPNEQIQVKQLMGIQPDVQGTLADGSLDAAEKKAVIAKVHSDMEKDKLETLISGVEKANKQ